MQLDQLKSGGVLPRLFYVLCLWQLVLHALATIGAGDPRLVMPHMVSWLHDVLLLGLIASTAYGIGYNVPLRRSVVHNAAVLLIALVGAVMAVYPQLLREYLSFPANIFSSDFSSLKVTLFEYVGVKRLWPALAALLLSVGILYSPAKTLPWRVARLILLPAIIMGVVTLPRSPHPVIHSIKQYGIAIRDSKPRVVPSLHRPSGGIAPSENDTGNSLISNSQKLTAERIFIIVLESITSAEFESRFLTDKSRFLTRMRGNYTYYKNYHSTNLDSYTSLIAMLTSKQVPYRAYSDERLYSSVNQAANIIRSLRELGYYIQFVSTCSYHPFVPVRSDWNRIIIRSDLPSQSGLTEVGSSRMEEAVEDRAALSTIVDAAIKHPKSVVMHELIYGHTTEWQAKTGISPLDYYDSYLAELFDSLKAKGLDRGSLFVVVSDHGDRSLPSRVESYRVPLLIAGEGVKKSVDTGFRNHLDLQGILSSYLNGAILPQPREKMFTVGSTERWTYGELRANGDHLFIDDSSGTVLSEAGLSSPSRLQKEFQSYLDQFGARYGNKSIELKHETMK